MIKIIFSTIFPISYSEIAENCQNRNFTKINLKHVWNFKGFTPPPPLPAVSGVSNIPNRIGLS